MIIKLRPHHLLCILGWRSRGYSKAFTDNFNRVVAGLADDGQFELVVGVDDICGACPHNYEGSCRRGVESALPDTLDERVRAFLRLETGHIYYFAALTGEIKSKLSPDDLSAICAGCKWLDQGWCRQGLSLP